MPIRRLSRVPAPTSVLPDVRGGAWGARAVTGHFLHADATTPALAVGMALRPTAIAALLLRAPARWWTGRGGDAVPLPRRVALGAAAWSPGDGFARPADALEPAPPGVPFTIDFSTTAYLHGSEDGGFVLGMSDQTETTGFDRAVTESWHRGLRAALSSFRPRTRRGADRPRLGGLYEMTPDPRRSRLPSSTTLCDPMACSDGSRAGRHPNQARKVADAFTAL